MDFFSIRFSIKVCQHVHGQYHQLHHPFNYGKDNSSDTFGEALADGHQVRTSNNCLENAGNYQELVFTHRHINFMITRGHQNIN